MRIRGQITFDSVLNNDVAQMIRELGITDDFEAGNFHCDICNDIIKYDNFKLIFPKEDQKFGFICNKPKCFVEFALRE